MKKRTLEMRDCSMSAEKAPTKIPELQRAINALDEEAGYVTRLVDDILNALDLPRMGPSGTLKATNEIGNRVCLRTESLQTIICCLSALKDPLHQILSIIEEI